MDRQTCRQTGKQTRGYTDMQLDRHTNQQKWSEVNVQLEGWSDKLLENLADRQIDTTYIISTLYNYEKSET